MRKLRLGRYPGQRGGQKLHFGFLVLEFGGPTVAGDLLLGAGWLRTADWDRGVPVTIGEAVVSLYRVTVQRCRLVGLEEILLAVGQVCLAGSR